MERDTFLKRIEAQKAAGLVDIKFLVKHGETLSEDDFVAAANRIDVAIADGRCVRTRNWTKDQEAKKSKLLVG